ncbi:hypothetical protein BHM03_00027986 [Ensete ventricosum]|nr:hypothetical protein BHM03_00027986 [Ensete ventricosum]
MVIYPLFLYDRTLGFYQLVSEQRSCALSLLPFTIYTTVAVAAIIVVVVFYTFPLSLAPSAPNAQRRCCLPPPPSSTKRSPRSPDHCPFFLPCHSSSPLQTSPLLPAAFPLDAVAALLQHRCHPSTTEVPSPDPLPHLLPSARAAAAAVVALFPPALTLPHVSRHYRRLQPSASCSPSTIFLHPRRCHPPLAATDHSFPLPPLLRSTLACLIVAPFFFLASRSMAATHPPFLSNAAQPPPSSPASTAPSSAAAAPILLSFSLRCCLPLPPLPLPLPQSLPATTLPPPSPLPPVVGRRLPLFPAASSASICSRSPLLPALAVASPAYCHSSSHPRHHPLQQPLPLLAAVTFPSSTTEITLSHITQLLPSSSSASHVVVVADAASCSHVVADRHCPFFPHLAASRCDSTAASGVAIVFLFSHPSLSQAPTSFAATPNTMLLMRWLWMMH